jgi:hypothetical protein
MFSEHATAFCEASMLTCAEIHTSPDPVITRVLTEQEHAALLVFLQSN